MNKPPKSRMPPSGTRRPRIYPLDPVPRSKSWIEAKSGPVGKCSHTATQHDVPAVSPLECYRIAVWGRHTIDHLLSRLDRGSRRNRRPAAWFRAIKVLEWVRGRLARTDELIRHPERIRDPRELAMLLNHATALTGLAEQAMQVIKGGAARFAMAKQPPLLWPDQALH